MCWMIQGLVDDSPAKKAPTAFPKFRASGQPIDQPGGFSSAQVGISTSPLRTVALGVTHIDISSALQGHFSGAGECQVKLCRNGMAFMSIGC